MRVFSTRIQPREYNVTCPDLFKVPSAKISMLHFVSFVGLQKKNAMKCFIVRMLMMMATSTMWNSPKPSNTARKMTDFQKEGALSHKGTELFVNS